MVKNRYKYSHAKIFDFLIAADNEILKNQEFKNITDFEKFIFSYQIKHYEKYGNYLIF